MADDAISTHGSTPALLDTPEVTTPSARDLTTSSSQYPSCGSTSNTSRPQDLCLPSFLDRPPEIRNAIYETLFQYDKPLDMFYTFSRRGLTFRPVPGIQLLRTCQQVYEEAVGVLYSRNTYKFIPITISPPDLSDVGKWLDIVGSRKRQVRKLIIDMSRSCSAPCPLVFGRVDVLPVLRHMGPFGLHKNLEVLFIRKTGDICRRCGAIKMDNLSDMAELNTLLNNLAMEQSFELRTYLRCLKSLKSVQITVDGSMIEITLGTRNQSSDDRPVVCFAKSLDGSFQRIQSSRPAIELLRILTLGHTGDSLLEELVPTDGPIIYDLNKNTTSHRIPSILQVNRTIREAGSCIYDDEMITVRASTEDTEHGFDDFELLDDYFLTQVPSVYQWSDENHQLQLNFRMKTQKRLDSMRLKAIDLVRATQWLTWSTEVHFQMLVSDQEQAFDKHSIVLRTLRFNLLVFFTCLILAHPDRRLLPSPTIWMNCQGGITCAQFVTEDGETDTITNRFLGWAWQDENRIRKICIRKIEQKRLELANASGGVESLLYVALEHLVCVRF